MAAILGLLLLGVLITGAELWASLVARADSQVDEALAQKVAELRSIVESGNPETGEAWPDLDAALVAGIERQVPAPNQVVVAAIDGEIVYQPRLAVPLLPDGDDALVSAAATAAEPVYGSAASSAGPLRWATLPVQAAEDDRQGVLIAIAATQPQRDQASALLRAYAVSSAVTLLVVGLVGWFVTGRLLRPLRDLRDTSERISDSDLSGRLAVTGTDEISALATTFNGMLDRLQAAFTGQRQFLNDTGHELRTPLTVISGHLQVMDADDPEDVARTRDLLLDEISRMSRLLDDLSLLAKRERPDFVEASPRRVADLIDSVLVKASATASRSWAIDEQADGMVLADAQRVTQALLQLVSNAVRHTGDGDVVALGSRRNADGVVVWVRDSGPGIPAAERDEVFQRFRRGENAHGEGSGLGLAIVAAIAQAHGGRAWAAEAAGGGALMSMWLPDAPAASTDEAELAGSRER